MKRMLCNKLLLIGLIATAPLKAVEVEQVQCQRMALQQKALREKGKGPIFVVSGPSAAGKTTVITEALKDGGIPVRTTVSVTTRAPRQGEQDGVSYYFWDKASFESAVKEGRFVEWAEVHGNFYGTLRSEVDNYRRQGTGVVLIIDVQGAANIKKLYPDAITVFLKTSTMAELEQRLRGRGTETEEAIQKRLANARKELEFERDYQFSIINDKLAESVANVRQLLVKSF
jgi:guanylate kinase